ncbi:C-3 sterol dehydrogenase [Coprinopsis cinerea AmutBmut pab1-1]|nr:C-3 sterol dehydrogenase [Coprinopsis cinerea AmutBmut pab1-1]
MTLPQIALYLLSFVGLLVLYIRHNDKRLRTIPERAKRVSGRRVGSEDVERLRRGMEARTRSKYEHARTIGNGKILEGGDGSGRRLDDVLKEKLPPKTGRRYIVLGGSGFLGGWVVVHLLLRGEDPKRIRVLDINPPVNFEVEEARKRGLQYFKVDVRDSDAVEKAFCAPWPEEERNLDSDEIPVTVFHTAANIRFWERHPVFLERSTSVNLEGTKNVVKAAKKIGVDALVYTSSASIGIKSTRFLLWPWEKEPRDFVQVINDDDGRLPKEHWEYFSNYAVSKRLAEEWVRGQDGTATGVAEKGKVLRVGAIRPGNGVFGPRGDLLCGALLVRESNPTFLENSVQSFCYVENCALAHLLYERRLIDLGEGNAKQLPDIGGQSFCIADPGPVPTYGDAYTVLNRLSEGECFFVYLSPTMMLFLAFLVEAYYVAQHFITAAFPFLSIVLPPLKGDTVNLQTGLFNLASVHVVVDDSRARLSPEKGGLGYEGVWTTLEGLYKTWEEHHLGVSRSEARSDAAGISLGWLKRKARGKPATMNGKRMEDSCLIGVTPVVDQNGVNNLVPAVPVEVANVQ